MDIRTLSGGSATTLSKTRGLRRAVVTNASDVLSVCI